MAQITKDMVKKAFEGNKMRRRNLLYEYYKEEYFTGDYTCEFIAEQISKDLDFKISKEIINQIRFKFSKASSKKITASSNNLSKESSQNIVLPKGGKNGKKDEEEEYNFMNADELPKKSPFGNAFAHLKKKTN
ncbi:hypothetical protein [Xanthocytophaga flava]|uniref:hypothetical protein n=1 Tax=Xanthocytophaga flava TaxID=3048013 RepID=UPI0028D6BA40|nr:hypothetical protein [Xanthocytophaga flavus]MDJ1470249.1 hypothetical protein [Xanthocytophaga flavus]